jgi:hypothetical protein
VSLTRLYPYFFLFIAPLFPSTAASQDTSGAGAGREREKVQAWNSRRARELIERAIERRASWIGDDRLEDYRASAQGHIYFVYDLGSGTERHLVKADQLALRLYWAAPNRTRQVVVGRRARKSLPTSITYHLDHLTVVMDNFGDRISLGEGSEVRDVLHPAAPGAQDFYQYRLTDSLTLVIPQREVQVYKLEMRPADPSRPGVVGALYLDRATADIVQMEFTFTAAAYLDETLDYFNVRLENALWAGRYWLPRRQSIELRREFHLLEFPAGGIIRAEFRIFDYEFNTGIDDRFFRGPRVSALPEAVQESYEFDEGLYDALDPDVATAPPSMEGIRREATSMVERAYLRRIEGLRFAVPGVSSVLRFRRGEGLYAGPGLTRRLREGIGILLMGGYAIGADRWELTGRVRAPLGSSLEVEAEGHYHRLSDATPWAASSGAVASLAALLDGEDYREPYWADGGALAVTGGSGSARGRALIGWEDWEPAGLAADDVVGRSYRPVRTLDEGEVGFLALELWRPPVAAVETVGGIEWRARLEAASAQLFGDFEYVSGLARARLTWPRLLLGADLSVGAGVAAVGGGRIPAQRLLSAGGRGSVRGYSFHRFAGNLYGDLGIEASRPLVRPFISVGLFADLAWVGAEGGSVRRALRVWNRTGDIAFATRGPLVGVGGGVGLLFDILHVELARGLTQGGIWELVVRVRRPFWAWL